MVLLYVVLLKVTESDDVSKDLLYINSLYMSWDIGLILKFLLLTRMESNVLGDVNIISNNIVISANIYFALYVKHCA